MTKFILILFNLKLKNINFIDYLFFLLIIIKTILILKQKVRNYFNFFLIFFEYI